MHDIFSIAATPHLIFGSGKISSLPNLIARYGKKVLLVTGASSLQSSKHGKKFIEELDHHGIAMQQCNITREPSPAMIDDAVIDFQSFQPDVVVAIGGGSALDAGKAISAMLPLRDSVKLYLEGVGTRKHPGTKVPFIALPTTSGTGSEATKNAVLSEVGAEGYKRSLRHDNFVPDIAIVDPSLTLSCPATTTAASGMDAFTQLLESYLSSNSNPVTDSMALLGLEQVGQSLLRTYHVPQDEGSRAQMSLAAFLSGVTLANAGLGTIHGFASSVGSRFDIPHGVICSALMYPVNLLTVRRLREEDPNSIFLRKYAKAGRLFATSEHSDDYYVDHLLETIQSMKEEMRIPVLSAFGIEPAHLPAIAATTENKYNPVPLSKDEMVEALTMAL